MKFFQIFFLEDTKEENAVEYEITIKTADKMTAGTGKFASKCFP
jgi:hypothetical protein